MEAPSPPEVTQLLLAWSQGEQAALDKLIPVVTAELRRLAHHYMGGERPDHTLQTTALVNEAYLKLIDQRSVNWQNRAHFFAICARQMRFILTDSHRAKLYQKRGAGAERVSLDESAVMSPAASHVLIKIDDALNELAAVDQRKSQVVELRFFGGLSVKETAAVLKVSPETVMRDWKLARAWLLSELDGQTIHAP